MAGEIFTKEKDAAGQMDFVSISSAFIAVLLLVVTGLFAVRNIIDCVERSLIGVLSLLFYHLSGAEVFSVEDYLWSGISLIIIIALLFFYARMSGADYIVARRNAERLGYIESVGFDWLWEADSERVIRYLSDNFERVTGCPVGSWLGRRIDEKIFFDDVVLEECLHLFIVNGRGESLTQCSYITSGGRRYISHVAVCAFFDNVSGELIYRGVMRSVREKKEMLPLHRKSDQVHSSSKSATGTAGKHNSCKVNASIIVSPVCFANIHGRFGRAIAEQIILELFQRFLKMLRPGDFLANYSSEELLVVVYGESTTEQYVVGLCQRFIDCVRLPFYVGGNEIHIDIKAGVAIASQAEGRRELFRAAEIALYCARCQKHKSWCLFTKELALKIMEESQLEADLYRAITEEQLCLYFQPCYCVADLSLMRVEALVRWNHPVRGLLNPNGFIPLAETSNLILLLDDWVLKRACEHAVTFKSNIVVSVNVSAKKFCSRNLVRKVSRALKESGLPASRLELEITESALIEDVEVLLENLKELKSLGVKLSLDDFGTGYSSFCYLKMFLFDTLKIDRSFISELGNTEYGVSLVSAMIWLGHALSMQVIAEGVEDEQQLKILTAIGCDQLQGYHLQIPMPVESLRCLLSSLP